MPEGGQRTSLTASYSWGQQGWSAVRAGVPTRPGHLLARLSARSAGTRAAANPRLPVGVNTITTPRAYEPISFAELRALADAHDITRLAIETARTSSKSSTGRSNYAMASHATQSGPPPTRATAPTARAILAPPRWRRPFATWLRELLDDVLVLDAPALELRHNRGGDLIGLDVVDGATIKLLIDDTGRRPKPPAPGLRTGDPRRRGSF